MKVNLLSIGTKWRAIQTMEPTTGVQNTITATDVYYHKNRRSRGIRIDDGVYDVERVELSLFNDEFVIILHKEA